MPGTWGSLGAVPIGTFLLHIGGVKAILIAIAVLFPLTWWLTELYITRYTTQKDPCFIVMDEAIGMLLSMTLCNNEKGLILLSFFLFRLFDIIKIWPANRAENLSGNGAFQALGILLDDVIAGAYAAIIVWLAHTYWYEPAL